MPLVAFDMEALGLDSDIRVNTSQMSSLGLGT
jgi:hypothetical protein